MSGAWRAAVVLLLAAQLGLSFWPALGAIGSDFANYYVPARVWLEGGALDRLYERDAFQVASYGAGLEGLGSFVPHPPAAALLLAPFAALGPLHAKACWVVVLALAYGFAYLMLRRALSLPPGLLALVFLLPSASLANALAYGQPYPLLLLLLAASLAALVRGRAVLAGALIAPVALVKLYGLPFPLGFLRGRRFGAAGGFAAAALGLAGLSALLLGAEPHVVFLREILPRSLRGEVQDPYSPIWGSLASLARRLFRAEPDFNPEPAADLPALASGLAAGAPAFVLLLAVLETRGGLHPAAARRDLAVLTLGALAASPLTATYHFVLLALPVAVLIEGASPRRAAAVLLLHAFATSSLTHHVRFLAEGWGNLLAYPRLVALLALFVLALRPGLSRRSVAVAAAGASVLGVWAALQVTEPPGARVEVRGYLAAEPVWCEGGLAWTTVEGHRLVVRGVRARGGGAADEFLPRCVDGRLETASSRDSSALEAAERDVRGDLHVVADREAGGLVERSGGGERVLARGRIRRPRLSPDGTRVAYQRWRDGSWDVYVLDRMSGAERRVAAGPANELEPAWTPDGLVFASDYGRGLGATTLFRAPF